MNVKMLMQFYMQYHSDKILIRNMFKIKETTQRISAHTT